MTESTVDGSGGRFSVVAGGPFYAGLSRLGLVGEDGLPLGRAGVVLALVAWAGPAFLAVVQALAKDGFSGWGYFTDLTVYARFLIAISVMVAIERVADSRLNMLAEQFRGARLIRDDGLPGFRFAIERADRLSGSALAEGILALSALIWSGITSRYAVEIAGSGWDGIDTAGGVEMSWAGLFVRFVSNPLFLFLVLRWFWRFLLWALLLFRISRLPLQLAPLHPDKSAGLGFLSIYPSIFSGFLFALGCVVAASFLKDLSVVDHSAQVFWFAVGGWIVIATGLFLGPLLVFARPLYLVRERALLEYGRLGNQHHLAFDRKWVHGDRTGEGLVGHPDISSTADMNGSLASLDEMRLVPVDRASVMGLLFAAALPMLPVIATRVPLSELVKLVAGAIF